MKDISHQTAQHAGFFLHCCSFIHANVRFALLTARKKGKTVEWPLCEAFLRVFNAYTSETGCLHSLKAQSIFGECTVVTLENGLRQWILNAVSADCDTPCRCNFIWVLIPCISLRTQDPSLIIVHGLFLFFPQWKPVVALHRIYLPIECHFLPSFMCQTRVVFTCTSGHRKTKARGSSSWNVVPVSGPVVSQHYRPVFNISFHCARALRWILKWAQGAGVGASWDLSRARNCLRMSRLSGWMGKQHVWLELGKLPFLKAFLQLLNKVNTGAMHCNIFWYYDQDFSRYPLTLSPHGV